MKSAGPANGRLVAGVVLGFILAQGLGFAADFSSPTNPNAAALPSHNYGVLVTTDKLHYELGETIVVQVSNGLDAAITTRDQRFQCTIIAIEHLRESGDWTEVRNCFSGAPPSEVTLAPGSIMTIRLEFGGSPFGGLGTGQYRAVLDYSRGDQLTLADGNLLVARSEQFEIEQQGR